MDCPVWCMVQYDGWCSVKAVVTDARRYLSVSMNGPNVPLNYSIAVQAWEWILPHHLLTVTLDKTQNLPRPQYLHWYNKNLRALAWSMKNDRHSGWQMLLTQQILGMFNGRVWQLLCYSQFISVTQSCPTLCNPMDCIMPDLPVHHQLLEFTQTHVHWVSETIQPSHPLLSSSSPALNLSQHQGLFKWVSSLHHVTKVLEFQL